MIDRTELERLYLVEHLTMQQIGDRLGCTRSNIHHKIRRFKIDGSTAGRFNIKCDKCGKLYSITRKRFKLTVKHFCSMSCYADYMHNPEYIQYRNGQTKGRSVMAKSLGRSLRDGETVHHEDGNNMNNDISNLRLFNSPSEHIAYHHKLRRERLESLHPVQNDTPSLHV